MYLTLLRRFGPYLIIAALLAWCLTQRTTIARLDGKIAHYADVMSLTKERIAHAQSAAEAADRKHAMDVAAQQDTISKDVADDLETKLAQARADAAAYARRLRAGTTQGVVGQPDLPASPDTAGRTDATDQTAELDALACGEAVTVAQGWQDWWAKVSKVPR